MNTRRLTKFTLASLLALGPLMALPYPSAALSTDQQAVINLTVSAVRNMPIWNGPVSPAVTEISIVNGYALAVWVVGEGGGQSLLSKNGRGVWSVIDAHGGRMDPNLLVSLGVPSNTAADLERGLASVPTPTPPASCTPRGHLSCAAVIGAQAITRTASLSWLGIKASLYDLDSPGPVLRERLSTSDPKHHSVVCISPVLDVKYLLEDSRGNVLPMGARPAFEPLTGAGLAPAGVPDQCKTAMVSTIAVAIPIKSLYPRLHDGRYTLWITY